ncbi:2-octaprenyl-6-methoxyphenyl hydroxylase [Halomonas elongata]|uniref:2-octaprenyl-6-methoxyphenyl hydroxylase n=1 Tax=Halomonas elongata (strain ATCC 33173 / DSM 2581 / NBRC 15536 / NCIMB 2198 / 1H9) TaxID=768066 RepID=E1V472_HALED|nr:2-octaprenyl-6-methoxyphenyl hydroxylase [Halomonas elongata]RAW08652.1 2-octaprenyl-6-methoxyphenyl hydroxylase [Halomonas elongata]WBF18151.1 2-octaprenyl-6-methoxyphenyl hydroxylase [Halomonas elongata]WPU47002.1 2-octaprenyl-6-methoxyphenyl hydroxylase [Halomonas elongata DSM 2581]WVI71706.1 2-octaprenyl-6-methoxyphenyl hydroxylase [Halomonas elongata]CBV40909.1 2-octaprenyl-6-methoxyphenyl hydroxylase [Halomonas elongata DSM 2581]
MSESISAEAPRRVDIAIVGGGLVGASLGAALAPLMRDRALSVAVIEAASVSDGLDAPWQPSFDARASAISRGTANHFDSLGVWSSMAERASPIRCIHVSERGRLGATRLRAEEFGEEAMGHVIPNAWMGRVLHRRLAELPLAWHCPARVESIQPRAGGHWLELSDGARLEAGLTVLADGGRSGLKERLGIESREHPYEQAAVIATVELDRPHDGMAYERFTPSGPIALLPMAGQRMALVWTFAAGGERGALALSDADFLARLQASFGDRAGRFRRVGKRHAYPLSLVTASETVRPGLAVMGNAAHALHPVAGQGFNLALRGVMDLVAAIEAGLARGDAPGEAATLNDFEARRSGDRDNVIRFSDGLVRLFGYDHPLLSHARAAGLVGLNLLGPLRRTLARRAMGMER